MSKKVIYYNPILKERAKKLRKNSTLSEVLLWKKLKSKQLKGFKFIRQKPINNYIVDFFCFELMLAIEIDGETHSDREEYDLKRDEKLRNLGITVLRFGDLQVKKGVYNIVLEIEEWIDKNCNK